MKLFYEHYIKLEHIGRGANAHVYKVRHAELGYVRAIKVLNEYIEDKNEHVYQSFLKECKTLLTIGNGCHPNIVRIYGPDLVDNHAIVEMDYIKGKTLDSYIKQKGFVDYEEVKTFIKDIVGALAYTHYDIYDFLKDPEADDLTIDPNDGSKYLITPQREAELVQKYSIVHNDLHSNNIMRRDYDGRFVLLDFGLAVQAGRCVKSSSMRDGSPEYQAPEKYDSDIIDPRSDVYSLGILMYEVLAGRVPFEIQVDGNGGVSDRAIDIVLKQHQSATPPPILPFRKVAFEKQHPGAAYERDYPEWLDDVIMKCLAKKPDARYKNAKELLADINAHLKNDAPDNAVIKKLRDSLAQLGIKCHAEESKNADLNKKLQNAKTENARLLEQLDATTNESEKIQELRENVAKLSRQLLNEKKERERLVLQSYDNRTAPKAGNKKPIILLGTLAAILLCCAVGIWWYKDSQIEKLSQNPPKIASNVGSKDADSTAVSNMPESPTVDNAESANYAQQIADYKATVDSLQGVIANSQPNNTPADESGKVAQLQARIDDLNAQIATLKKKSGTTKVVNQTPPSVQKELDRLRAENKKLKGQVERFIKELSN